MPKWRIQIKDTNGVPRCFAYGTTITEAIDQAIQVASEYAVKRPDTVPLRLASAGWDEVEVPSEPVQC